MDPPPPNRPPPAYSEEPDDPFQPALPPDPNLSYTTPPNPANMRLPQTASSNDTWHVISAGPAVGMSNNWQVTTVIVLLVSNITSGISGVAHVSFNSWEAALQAYTDAYNANAVEILPCRPGRSWANRRSRTPRATPGATRSNPYFVVSNEPTPVRNSHAQQPASVGGSPTPVPRSEARLRVIQQAISELGEPKTPTQGGDAEHPIMIGSSPAPALDNNASPTCHNSTLPGTPVRQSSAAPETPLPLSHGPNSVRARLLALETFLRVCEERDAVSRDVSPATPTSENSSIEARLAALEGAMNDILTREAQRASLQADIHGSSQASSGNLTSASDLSPSASRNEYDSVSGLSSTVAVGSSSGHGTVDASPIAGSSTGPGTLASATSQRGTSAGALPPRNYSVVVIDDDSDEGEYEFDSFSPEEHQELEELLNAIHENYNANKAN